MKFRLALPTLLLSLVSAVAYAAPSISNVKIINNDTHIELIINGSNFGSGPNVILFDTFSGGNEGDAIPFTSPEVGSWSDRGGWEGIARYGKGENGDLGHRIRDFDQPTSSMNRLAQLDKDLGGNQKEIFFSFEAYVPPGSYFSGASSDNTYPDNSSWKFTWLTDSEGVLSGDNLYDMCIPSHVGSGNFLIGGNEGNVNTGTLSKDWWAWHKTNHFSFWQKAEGDNGAFLFYAVNETNGFTNRSSANTRLMYASPSFNNIRFPGWFGNGSQSNFNAIYDNIYIAVGPNSQARVELSDAENYEDSTFLKIFPPSTWSSSEIALPLYGLTKPVNSLYLHITDSNGNRSPGVHIGTISSSISPPKPQTMSQKNTMDFNQIALISN